MKYKFTEIVIDSRTGLNPRKNFVLGNGDNYYITIKDIYDDSIHFTDKTDRVDDEAIQIIKKRSRIKVGDVLFVSIGRIGETAIVTSKDDSWDVNESVFVFTLNDKIIIPEFFCYLFRSNNVKNYLARNSSGSTFKSIKMNQLSRMSFDLPSIEIQRTINKKLNITKNLINLRQQQLAELDNLIKSRFMEMFGSVYNNKYNYPINTLEQCCEQIKDGTHQTPTYVEDSINGYKFLSSKDVTKGYIDWSSIKYIPESLHNELYKRISPRKGDILLAKNGTTGVAALVETDDVFDIYVSLALLRPVSLNSTYLLYSINSDETRNQFNKSLKGVGVPNLHLGEIKKTKIINPPLVQQIEFETFVHQVDKSKVDILNSMIESWMMKKTLLNCFI